MGVCALKGMDIYARVPLKLKLKRRGLNLDYNLTVLGPHGDVPFAQWLRDLFRTKSKQPTGSAGYDLQLQWWHARNTSFKLEDLPQELQDLVLLHCIGVVRPVDFGKTLLQLRLHCKAATETGDLKRDPFSSAISQLPEVSHRILSLNRRFRPIAKKLLRDSTMKQLHKMDHLVWILGKCPTTYINPKRSASVHRGRLHAILPRPTARYRYKKTRSTAACPRSAGLEQPPVPRNISRVHILSVGHEPVVSFSSRA